jgi:RNA polymerase sigma factor (sigma-70 family)
MTVINDPAPDAFLLAEVGLSRSQEAFRLLVLRYVDLVHSSAIRQIHDSHLAEEITQAVFLLLWQRAGALKSGSQLGGWLLLTTRNIARNLHKREDRLRRRERKAAMMNPELDPSLPAQANEVLPLLDDAMARLPATDRDVIVERFFHSRTHHEVAEKLGLSEHAASKRVSRALIKLRNILEGQGVSASDAMLSSLMSAAALKPAAPVALVATIHSTIPAGAASPTITALAKGVATAAAKSTVMTLVIAGVIAIAAVAGVIVVLHAHGPKPSIQAAIPAKPLAPVIAPAVADSRTVTLMMIDPETNKPIENAQVEVQLEGNKQTTRPAGADGKVVLTAPMRFQYLQILARAPDRVPMGFTFRNSTFHGDLLSAYMIPMEKGTRIGGIVTDEDGEPLGDAEVRVNNYDQLPDAASVMLNEVVHTDADGKWHIDDAPSKLENVSFEINQPGFPKGQSFYQNQVASLRAETYTAVLKHHLGIELDGVVLDPNGKPIQGANVVVARDRYLSNKPSARTDSDGKFHVENVTDEYQIVVTATARGYGPAQVTLPDAKKSTISKPLELKLSSPVTLQGTVVDKSGKPIAGATVDAERWRDNRALSWSTKTDSRGQFVWKDAPAEPFQINIYKNSMGGINEMDVTAGKEPIKATLYPELKIHGNVVDAQTHEPIPKFHIIYGIRWPRQTDVSWQTQSARSLGKGTYDATITSFSNGGKLRVEADNYLPIDSRLIQQSEGAITLDFEMKKGSGPAGTVVDGDGKIVRDAEVICVHRSIFVNLDQDNLAQQPDLQVVHSDRDGRYRFQPEDKKYSLIAFADQGFAYLNTSQTPGDGKLKLQKWGRIEGDCRLNAHVARNLGISAHSEVNDNPTPDYYRVEFTTQTITDALGHFVIDRVVPGFGVQIAEAVQVDSLMSMNRFLGQYETVAGQTLQVHVGGIGRPVIAKAIAPIGVSQPINAHVLSVNVVPNQDAMAEVLATFPFPENFPDLPPEQQQQVARQLSMKLSQMLGTKALVQTALRFIPFDDGSIRADDVVPGKYTIRFHLREPYQNGKAPLLLGEATASFTVPTTPACPSEEVFDIGTIQLKRPTVIQVGKPWPAINLVTLDGKPIDQAGWAGKVVLIHPWGLQDRTFFPAIRQLSQKYKDKLVIVNVGRRMLPKWMQHIDGKEHLPGVLATDKATFELHWNDDDVQILGYAFTTFVLDKHGNLTAKITDAGALPAAVDHAMGN